MFETILSRRKGNFKRIIDRLINKSSHSIRSLLNKESSLLFPLNKFENKLFSNVIKELFLINRKVQLTSKL